MVTTLADVLPAVARLGGCTRAGHTPGPAADPARGRRPRRRTRTHPSRASPRSRSIPARAGPAHDRGALRLPDDDGHVDGDLRHRSASRHPRAPRLRRSRSRAAVVFNELTWEDGPTPEQWQPYPTILDRLAADGVAVTRIGPGFFDGSDSRGQPCGVGPSPRRSPWATGSRRPLPPSGPPRARSCISTGVRSTRSATSTAATVGSGETNWRPSTAPSASCGSDCHATARSR